MNTSGGVPCEEWKNSGIRGKTPCSLCRGRVTSPLNQLDGTPFLSFSRLLVESNCFENTLVGPLSLASGRPRARTARRLDVHSCAVALVRALPETTGEQVLALVRGRPLPGRPARLLPLEARPHETALSP